MAKKQVIFVNFPEFEEDKVTTFKIGPWSDKQQQEFMKAIREYQPQQTDCWCSFDVWFNNTCTYPIGLKDKPNVLSKKELCTEALKQHPSTKLIIEIDPFIKSEQWSDEGEDGKGWCTCGVSARHECPTRFMNGGCTHPIIGPMLGKFLCPGKYK